jgi:hypothetical protein
MGHRMCRLMKDTLCLYNSTDNVNTRVDKKSSTKKTGR